MNARNFTAAASMLAMLATPALAADNKVVIELFTSQGCSSCPAADRVLGELAHENKIIALSLPVDYWDYLGWRDTLAQPAHAKRQDGYKETFGERSVYTPQAVINGAAETVGSDRGAIEAAVKTIAARTEKTAVPVNVTNNGSNLDVDIGAGNGEPASVWLLTVLKTAPVAIGRGENHGKTVTYTNVVRSWQRICDWNGTAVKNSIPLADLNAKDADAVVILVQGGSVEKPAPIRGAAFLSLR
jgi:hypothetical protein